MKNYLVGPAIIPESARPVVIRVTEFDEDSAEEFSTQMSKAHETGQPIIPVIIDSYGGEVYALHSMISEIDHARLPVVTIVEGKAMSCGADLFACGSQRYMARDAVIMIHDISAESFGKAEEIKANAAQIERLQHLTFTRLAERIGKSKRYFLDIMDEKKHTDWVLTADEAKRHGLATHIGIPELRTTVSISMELIEPVRSTKVMKRVLTNRKKGTKVTKKRT